MSTELTEVTNAVAEFDRVGAGLEALRKHYTGIVYEVATTAGMNEARAARAAICEPRYEIERIRKAAKAAILALGKKLDSEATRITGEIEKIEAPIDQQIKGEEDRKERERIAKIEAEQSRVAGHQERVAYLRGNQTLTASSGSVLIAEHIIDLEGEAVDASPPPAPPPPSPAPVSRRGVVVPVPKASEMIEVLAKHYRARPDTIVDWLRTVDWNKAAAA